MVINPDQDGVLTSHIRDDPEWRLAFKDASGFLFVRA